MIQSSEKEMREFSCEEALEGLITTRFVWIRSKWTGSSNE